MQSAFVILLFFFVSVAHGSGSSHLIVKTDFNNDGVADRVVFASKEFSGFILSTSSQKKADIVFLRQGSRSIFLNFQDRKNPYLKIAEASGFFTVVTLMKYDKNKFSHYLTYVLPEKVYFSDDLTDGAIITDGTSTIHCPTNSEYDNKPIKETLSWSMAVQKFSIEQSVKKAIDPKCKTVLGTEYERMQEEIIAACNFEPSAKKKNPNALVSCLDSNNSTRPIAGFYQEQLAKNIFNDSFKISCEFSQTKKPAALFKQSENKILILQTKPLAENRNYKADFFHEMLHLSSVSDEKSTESLVERCLIQGKKNKEKSNDRYYTRLDSEIEKRKDGVEVNIPPQVKQVPQTTVASAVAEGSKALDSNFSMDNEPQYQSLAKASKATFRSFDPIMKAAYEAAVPMAFAQGTLAVNTGSGSASVAMPTVKATASSARNIASTSGSLSAASKSEPVYDVSSLPESVAASDKGDLGNGLSVKATTVNVKEGLARTAGAASDTRESAPGSRAGLPGSSGSLGYMPTTDRPDLRNNVPHLKAEEDFVKTLTTGRYEEVKARLTDPKNQQILEDKRIQYLARDRTLGSKQPVMILKDLGNKFSIVRVTIE